jgi:hypothetical protein
LQRQINGLLTTDLPPATALARAQRQSDLVVRAMGSERSA